MTSSTGIVRGLSALLLIAAASYADAQITVPPGADPGALQQRRIEEEQRRQEAERLQRKPVTEPLRRDPASKPDVRPDAPGAVSFLVKTFRFPHSEIFTPKELAILVENHENKRLTLTDLQRLVEHINGEYRKRGVVTAQAVLPPQDVTTGVIEIQLIEGRIGDVRIQNNSSTRESYILNRIDAAAGKLVDLDGFEAELKRFNRTNDVQLRAELKPGKETGTTDFILDVNEPPRHVARLTVDNLGSKSTGEWRQGLAYTNRSLLGFRDEASVSATRADGLKSYSVSYTIPMNKMGGRLTAALYNDKTQVKHGQLAPLAITGESTTMLLTARQPLYFNDTLQLDAVASIKRRDSENRSSGVPLQDNRAEDYSLGGEFQLSDARGHWNAGLNVSGGASQSRINGASSGYLVGRGNLRRTQLITEGWSARGALSFQRSSDNQLPAGEQFVIGGEGSVRGYPLGSYAGDQGYTVNLELHHPLWQSGTADSPFAMAATGMLFADNGRTWIYRPPGSVLREREEITSIGWGMHYMIGKRVSGRVIYAHPLYNLPQDTGRHTVHFQLVAQLL